MTKLLLSKEGILFSLFAICWLILWAVCGQRVTEAGLKELEKIGFSTHALTGHKSQAYDAQKIKETMITRKCTPMEYICADSDSQIYYCRDEKNPAKAIGLVVGRTVRKIVTGFVGSTKYWESRCP